MSFHLRIARPVRDLERSARMYCQGLGLIVLDRFEDHDGFDGVMIGQKGAAFHLEFTSCREHALTPTPTHDDLLVFYVPSDAGFNQAYSDMLAAGFELVPPFNPYWEQRACTFMDQDAYRVVLHRGIWSLPESASAA